MYYKCGVVCGRVLCAFVCCEHRRTFVLALPWTLGPLGGAPVAVVRAVAVLAAGAAGEEGLLLLLAAVRPRAGVRAAHPPATSHDSEAVAASSPLVAMRHCAAAECGAQPHRAPVDVVGGARRRAVSRFRMPRQSVGRCSYSVIPDT